MQARPGDTSQVRRLRSAIAPLAAALALGFATGAPADGFRLSDDEARLIAVEAIFENHPSEGAALAFMPSVVRRCDDNSPFTEAMGCFTELSAYLSQGAETVVMVDTRGNCVAQVNPDLGYTVYVDDNGKSLVMEGHGTFSRPCTPEEAARAF